MGHFYAKSSNFGIFNPLNPPYQGDFKRKCVSPIDKGFVRFHWKPSASGEPIRETQHRCDCGQYAPDNIGIFQVPSTVSPHGEIVQSSSDCHTPVVSQRHPIGNLSENHTLPQCHLPCTRPPSAAHTFRYESARYNAP